MNRARRARPGRRRPSTAVLSPSLNEATPDAGAVGDRMVVFLLSVLRVGTLVLGGAETADSSSFTHPGVVAGVLAGLAFESAVVFGRALFRITRGSSPVLDLWTVLLETASGVTALLLMADATPVGLRATSTFWVEPYTVITAIVLAAAAVPRVIAGAAGVIGLTAAYLISQLAWGVRMTSLPSSTRAAAWTNAASYLPFFLICAVAFPLVRGIVRQTEDLRRMLVRLSAERARVAAASGAYRLGHDIPKALLREVRRGSMTAEQLRPWASQYRDDLLAALSNDPGGGEARLIDELTSLTSAFGAAMKLTVDVEATTHVPSSAPVLLIVEAVRELLNNASYHAYGYPVTVQASSSDDAVTITVNNEGPGVDPRRLASSWSRKQNTLHQLEAAGGSYSIDSSPGSNTGTAVTVSWPGLVPDTGRIAPVDL